MEEIKGAPRVPRNRGETTKPGKERGAVSRLNTDLMLQIREQITSHPETHSQDTFGMASECGTTHCMAGWACVLSGIELEWLEDDDYAAANVAITTKGRREISDTAMELLGLTANEAAALFYDFGPASSRATLDRLIEKGKNGGSD